MPMKKVSLVVMKKYRKESLNKLRDVGVLHLEHKTVNSDRLSAFFDQCNQVETARTILEPYKSRAILHEKEIEKKWASVHRRSVDSADESISDRGIPLTVDALDAQEEKTRPPLYIHILQMEEKRLSLLEREAELLDEQRKLFGWGNFNPQDLRFLSRNGVRLFLYELSPGVLKYLPPDVSYVVVNKTKDTAYVVSLGMEIPNASPLTFGRNSLAEVEDQLIDTQKQLSDIDKEFLSLYFRRQVLDAELNGFNEQIDFEIAYSSMGTFLDVPIIINVSWISGFTPPENVEKIRQLAIDNGWAFTVNEPGPEDLPPTILESKSIAKIVQPLFKLLGTIPGYWEYDISVMYMLFFCIFFAMIYGDAGYGLIFLFASLISIIAFKVKSGKVPDLVKLLTILSFFTIVWGSFMGAWFAIPHEYLPSFLRFFILPPFDNTGPVVEFPAFLQNVFNLPETVPVDEYKTRWNVQFVCFSIALIQLISARTYLMSKLLPSLTAFAQIGLILMISGIYFLVLSLLLSITLPVFAIYLIAIGVVINIIFSEQKGGNFFANIGKSFSNFFSIFLKIVGSFSDIISYIRLFAVGLAGSLIAGTVNTIAISSGGLSEGYQGFALDFLIKLIITSLILVFGHALNLMMSSLSVVVHGIRLNLLEFAGNHLGMEWSGYDYKPFALKQMEIKT